VVKSIVLIGGFSEIIELCKELQYKQIFIVDKVEAGRETIYLGKDEVVQGKILNFITCDFCITPDLPSTRENIFYNYNNFQICFPSIISKGSKISDSADIGKGSVIQYGSFISSDVRIGKFVKLNVNSCVMHDSVIGDFSTLAPSCNILGRVIIGSNCYIGTSAIIMPGVTLCNDVIVGAGAVVTKSITIPGVYVGIPAVKIK
jgi:sugar O-acyltransferase (sialic acid O-acetyltransferase NeuD family)